MASGRENGWGAVARFAVNFRFSMALSESNKSQKALKNEGVIV
jgi:hypothetical protein